MQPGSARQRVFEAILSGSVVCAVDALTQILHDSARHAFRTRCYGPAYNLTLKQAQSTADAAARDVAENAVKGNTWVSLSKLIARVLKGGGRG